MIGVDLVMIKSGLSVVVSRPCDRKTSQERGTVLLWVVELGSIKTTLGAAFALDYASSPAPRVSGVTTLWRT